MTTVSSIDRGNLCPAQTLMKMLAGKFKPEIFRLAVAGPVRFNSLLRQVEGANKQSVAIALKELHEAGLFEKRIVSEKPLHIEYTLSTKGQSLVGVFSELERISGMGSASQERPA